MRTVHGRERHCYRHRKQNDQRFNIEIVVDVYVPPELMQPTDTVEDAFKMLHETVICAIRLQFYQKYPDKLRCN